MLLNKTFYQGQSLTIGVLIAGTYDTANLQSSAIIIGEKKIASTVINQMLRFELSSEDTRNFITSKTVNLVIDDVYFGRREYPLGSLSFEKTKGQTIDASIDEGYTVVFNATINELAITVNSIMYDYVKGPAGSLSSVTASVDSNVGTPEVTVTYDGENADFAFKNLKGDKGDKGEQGEKGDDAVLPDGTVIDPNYVHTDNNYTTADKAKVAGAIQAETDPTVPAWAKETTKPTYTASEVGAEPIKGSDDNYVTDAEKTKLSNLSGTNTGDQDLSGLAPIGHTHPYEPANHTTLLDKNAELTFQHLDTTTEKTTPIDADSLGLWDSVTSTFKRLSVANTLAWFRGLQHTFSQLISFSGGVKTDTLTKLNGSGAYASEDGGTIWYTISKRFTPSGTFSSNGTAVTTTSGQLNSSMIGAKIGTGTDKRIVTAVANSNSCTVNSAFSQNYSAVSDWGVWSIDRFRSGNFMYFYNPDGSRQFWLGDYCQIFSGNYRTDTGASIIWSNNALPDGGSPSAAIYKPSPRTLKIYDGQNVSNAGDLIVRSVQVTDNTAAASITTVGMTRYRPAANGSYYEICMQTGANTFVWHTLAQYTW